MRSEWVLRALAKRWIGGRSDRKASRRPRRPVRVRPSRPLVEQLEDRTLLSVLPAPVVSGQQSLGYLTPINPTPNGLPNITSGPTQFFSSPVVSYDPANPQKVVSVYVEYDTPPGNPDFSQIDGNYSTDGGATWTSFTGSIPANLRDPNQAIANNPNAFYRFAVSPSVAFGRSGNFYLTYAEQDSASNTPTSSTIVLQKFSFGAAPSLDPTVQDTILYQAVGQDPAFNPTVAVDTNLASFTDPDVPTAVQTDPQGYDPKNPGHEQVYVAWNVTYSDKLGPGGIAVGNPIEIVASPDGGQTFSGERFLNGLGGFGNFGYFGAPSLAISQGSVNGKVPGGEVNAVFSVTPTPSNNNTGIDHNAIADGGSTQLFTQALGPGSGTILGSTTTVFTINVPRTVPATFTISDLELDISAYYPDMSKLEMDLVGPDGTDVPLFFTKTLTGANLGIIAHANDVDGVSSTVFDDLAPRVIGAKAPFVSVAPYVGRFQPQGVQFGSGLSSWDGKTLASLAGAWKLEVLDTENPSATSQHNIQSWSLRFTSGLDNETIDDTVAPIGTAAKASALLTAAAFPLVVPASPNLGIGPSPSIASDNTLGAFSPFQGRLYVAYVTAPPTTGPVPFTGTRDNTDIAMLTSDDGGRTWNFNPNPNGADFGTVVNQDNATTDGFSESDPNPLQTGTFAGRPQFMPEVAVDQANGTVLVQFSDARYDAARARLTQTLVTSIDGGQTFSPDVFLNPAKTAVDAITGKTVTLEPLPSNPAAIGGGAAQSFFGFGHSQGLAAYNGHAYTAWSGNQNYLSSNTGVNIGADVYAATVAYAAGPRVVSSDMGPVVNAFTSNGVTYNNTFAVDGTRRLDAFEVTFDRPVDLRTFTPAQVQVVFRDPNTPADKPGTPVGVASVQALDGGANFGPGTTGLDGKGNPVLAEHFLVHLAQPQSATGTYSYVIGPNVTDGARSTKFVTTATASFQASQQATPDVPQNFHDAQTIDAHITVSGVPAGNVITNVKAGLTIANYPFTGDLLITLIAPDGTRVVLSNQEPAPFSGNPGNPGFGPTLFDDNAPQGLASGAPPYAGTFRPDSALSQLNGHNPNGVWTLEVQDLFQSFPPVDFGILQDWSLVLGTGVQVTGVGNSMDQNANGMAGEPLSAGALGDAYAAPRPLSGIPFQFPYDPDTQPLIIPGPHVIQTFVPGLNAQGGPVNPPTADNLVVNQSVNAIDVVFDRDIDPATFTTAQLLRMIGPAGPIQLWDQVDQFGNPLPGANPLPGVSVTPDPNSLYPRLIDGITTTAADPGGAAHPRTFRIGLPTRVGAPLGTVGQDLSGTYSVTLASTIQSASAHEALDSNLNAGLDQLRNTAAIGSTAAAITFPSLNPQATFTSSRPVDSTLTITDDFAIQNITVKLNISYQNDPDLSAVLVAPDGTRVPLFSNVGNAGPTPHSNFTDTVFDDNASTPIQKGQPPFNIGSFNPQQPLSVLKGKSAAGIWHLIVTEAKSGGALTGTLNSWSLTLTKATSTSGLGESVADQYTATFRIFNQDPTQPLSHDVWTAVGGASLNGGGDSGRIGGLAVDPSDPSGNTIYAAGASGGVWKTNDFLTTSPNGPTWTPLTDFGPTFGINMGGLAVFGRNNDTRQSVIFAATGEGDTGSTGVGVLRSLDGGATWTLLDSTINYDSLGNEVPESQRDHKFVGNSSFKILVDPNPTAQGGVIVYVAMSGPNGGVWRSTDTGNTWTLMRAGQATDIVLNSMSAGANGNLQILYAGFANEGVFYTSSAPTSFFWNAMSGGQGDPLIFDFDVNPPKPLPFLNAGGAPNGARVALAAPFKTGNPAQDLGYNGWLYAAVTDAAGHVSLWMTKDFGFTWVKVPTPTDKDINGQSTLALPSNDDSGNLPNYDVGGGGAFTQGNYDLSLAIDPTNPNVVYLGGTADGQTDSLIRVDTTGISDAHAFFTFDNRDTAGGVETATTGGITIKDLTKTYGVLEPSPTFPGLLTLDTTPYINLLRDPTNPFLTNATLYTTDIAAVNNDGGDATWTPFGGSGGETVSGVGPANFLGGSTDHHRVVSFVDPLTGHARIIWGDDQGIWTAVDDNGTVDLGVGTPTAAPGSGLIEAPTGSRNGNIQITQFYFGAAQPSILAAQVAGALFYGQAQDDGFPRSDANVLSTGQIGWNGPGGDGGGVATDQTGGGTLFQYNWPCCGGGNTDFFQVTPPGGNPIGRTTGLVQGGDNPGANQGQWPNEGPINITVNPIDPNAALISSAVGRVFRTTDQGFNWFPIAQPGNLDSTHADALAFGAPDPASGGALDDFIYAGTDGGHIFVSFTGGGNGSGNGWFDLASSSLDGSPVREIVTNPKRGSYEAYAVTLRGVYHITYNVTRSPNGVPNGIAGTPSWTNITGNLFNITHVPFGDPNFTETQLRYLQTIVADWRFVIPDDPNNPGGTTHPLLYVGGEGGIYRSGDDGKNWTVFPDNLPVTAVGPDGLPGDGAPVPGGYLPDAHVTWLSLSAGNINPATGLPDQSTGPNLLLASTYGRGSFAIRLPLSSPYNIVNGPQIVSAVATNAANGVLPNPVNPAVGIDTVNLVFGGAVDPSTFTIGDVGLTGPQVTSITSSNGTATVTMPGPDGLKTGDRVIVSGASQVAYDGTFTITVTGPTTFTYAVSGGPSSPATGTITMLRTQGVAVASITSAPGPNGAVATVTTTGPVPFSTGDRVTISGANEAIFDGTFTVTVTGTNSFTYLPGGNPPASATGSNLFADLSPVRQLIDLTALNTPFAVTSLTSIGTTATVTTAGPNGLATGDVVAIAGANQAGYDGNFRITVTGPNTFIFQEAGNQASPATGVITATRVSGPTAHNLWQVLLAHQATSGSYSLSVAPNVTDYAGRQMDQDGDGQGSGGLPDDGFTKTFSIAGLQVLGVVTPATSTPAVSIAAGNGTVTVTTAAATGFKVGDKVTIAGANPAAFDGTFTVTGTPAANQFTYAVPGLQGPATGGIIDNTPVPTPPGLTSVVLEFNAKVDPASFSSGSVNLVSSIAGPVGIGSVQDVSAAFAADPVTAMAQANGIVSVTTARPDGLLNGDVVTIFGASPTGFDGNFNVVVTGPNSFTYAVPPGLPASATGTITATPADLHQDYWQVNLQAPQLAPGVYTLTVGPNVSDTGDGLGNNKLRMDQNGNGVYGETGVAPAGDQFQAEFSVDGLRVLSVSPSLALTGSPVLEPPGLSSATVTFNREVNPLSFTASQVVFTGPGGVAIPVTLKDLAPAPGIHNVWEVDFATQTKPGVYTMVIGPGVTDSTGTPMDQNLNYVFGEVPGDAYTAVFDIDGLAVTSATPGGPVPLPVGQKSVALTFNQGVLASTMNATDVTLTGPNNNPIALTKFTDLTGAGGDHTRWEIDFAAQTAYGTYTLTVGPGVEDLAGEPMNQNHNATFGEPGPAPTGDAFQSTFIVAGLHVTAVAPASNVPVQSTQGLSSATVTFNMPVDPTTFTTSALKMTAPDGTPITGLTLTDITTGTPDLHNVWQVTFPKQTAPGVYDLVVGPNVDDVGGNAMDQNGNGVHGQPGTAPAGDAYLAQFVIDGLKVTSVLVGPNGDPAGPAPVPGNLSSVTVTFNQAALASSLTGANVKLVGPNNNSIAPTKFTDLTGPNGDHSQWEVDFAPQTVYGTYTLTVGPGVEDLAGNGMNQNGNNVFDEPGPAPAGDAYQTTFAIDGLQVTNVTPPTGNPIVPPPGLSSITVNLNMGVGVSSFNGTTVVLRGPTGAAIPLTFTDTSGTDLHNVWRLDFMPQTAPGVYTLAVGPAVQDQAGNQMDQNENMVYGEAADQYVAKFDVIGLQVTSVTQVPAAGTLVTPGLNQLTVNFNEAVDPTSLTSSTVVLKGPNGQAVPLSFPPTDASGGQATAFTFTFAGLTAPGTYTLSVGPNVKDVAGYAMNQNGNGVFGEPGVAPNGDQYQTSFVVPGVKVLTPLDPDPSLPILSPQTLSTIALTFSEPVQADSLTASGSNPTVTLVAPNGQRVSGLAFTDLTGQATQFRISFPAQTTPGVYRLTVGPLVKDANGFFMDQNQNGVPGEAADAFTANYDVQGLRVVLVNPPPSSVPLPGSLNSITVTFNAAADPSTLTFTTASGSLAAAGGLTPTVGGATVVLTDPTGKPVTITSINDVSGGKSTAFRVQFSQLKAYGTYNLTVGPNVKDVAGNAMNQNGNTVYGEPGAAPAGDQFSTSFSVAGLAVASVSPAPGTAFPVATGLSSLTVTFNMGVNLSSVNPNTVVLVDPNGHDVPVSLVDISGNGLHNVWQVNFAAQTTQGNYTLLVGPNVQDIGGNPMDQNENGVYGEAADQFRAVFTVGNPPPPVTGGGTGGSSGGSVGGPSGPTSELTGQLTVLVKRLRRRKGSKTRWTATVEVFNTNNIPIQGLFTLVLDGLSGGKHHRVRLLNASGTTASGSPFVQTNLSAGQLSSFSGVTFTLNLWSQSGARPRFSTRVFQGPAS